jgi:tetratricopeptide (TPR) repeat protein
MKKLVYLLFLTTQMFFAQKDFQAGNALYKNGNYKAAITSYESVLASKKESSDLYFNLGNCYYKLNQVAPAVYHYEKALVLNPNNKEAANNLKFAQKLLIDEIKETPKVGFAKMLRNFTANYSYNTWAWISVVFASLFLLLFLGYYFLQNTVYKRVFFSGMFVALVLILISISAAFFEKNHYSNERPAVIFAASTALKKESKSTAKQLLMLHEGTKVYVLEKSANWKKVQLTDGQLGWIASDAIREVKN